MPSASPRLAVFLSGGGRSLVNLAAAIEAGRLAASIGLVIASRACAGCERARERGLECLVIPGSPEPEKLGVLLRDRGIEWIVLAGYLKILRIPRGFEDRAVNIHPALLPRYGGPGMHGRNVHAAVLGAGETRSGCTVHLCDDTYDTGPIVLQRSCPVLAEDTPETLAARVFEQECLAYPEALGLLISGKWKSGDPPVRY